MQVSLSQSALPTTASPDLTETQQLAWIQRTFEEVLRVIGWPKFIPPADTSFFLTTQLVFNGIAELLKSKDNLKPLNEIFFNDLDPVENKHPFPAEVYFIAMKLTQNNQEMDDWKVTVNPQKETVDLAKHLVNYTHVILECLRNQDHNVLKLRLPEFAQVWKEFLDQLVKEKRQHGSYWCGTFLLTNTLKMLELDFLYAKRKTKIIELAKQVHLSEESKLILAALNAEISSIVYKRKHKVENKEISLINETVAEHLLKLLKESSNKQVIDEMITKQEFVFIDMLLQFMALSGTDVGLLAFVKTPIIDLHEKLKRFQEKHPKTGLECIYRRIFESHATAVNREFTIKNKDSKSLSKDFVDFNIEWDLNAICATFYKTHRKDIDTIVNSLLLDYKLVMMRRVTGLAYQIIDLGLKTFEPKLFFAGYTKEISLLDTQSA